MDDWLRRRARANQASGATRTFVLCEGAEVIGYYALASGAVALAQAPGRLRRNMPEPVPVAVLARLALRSDRRGLGFGRALFRDAVLRVLNAAEAIGIRGLLVHALSEEAKAFYLRLGLEPSPLDPLTLMATLADLRDAVR
ncbi:GNAT family N-acetyltransferase [Phenylobacterium sp.]|uniref:GNAT family N-acetyltransferase n=1 Tax=Phenylobacterium sp. TaxID=1871053 RepID=UPI002DF12CDB|nr:GNAT family N-acetyltransferase [Phenylobacterium sp.]